MAKNNGRSASPLRGVDGPFASPRDRTEDVYSGSGKPLPPLLWKALEDLRPSQAGGESLSSLVETTRRHVVQLLKEVEKMPKLLDMGGTLTFMAAYRKRAELSVRDKETLDNIAEDLQRKIAR